MKKIYGLITLLIMSIALVGCTKSAPTSVVISKYYDAKNMMDNVIELYNTSEEEVKLDKLILAIYPNGDDTAEYKINLRGTIEGKGYYIITRENPINTIVKESSNFKTEDLVYTGNDMVALQFGDQILDAVGYYRSSADFGKDLTLIRKPANYEQKAQYDEFDYIIYQPEVFQYLGNMEFPIQTTEQLLNGPEMDSAYFDLPFVEPDNPDIGGGGFIEVKLINIADGDTATFNVPGLGNERVRYLYINTNEVQGTFVDEQVWGTQASNFNKQYLLGNLTPDSKIYLQSIKGLGMRDNTSSQRLLALVWVDGKLSNHIIVRNGLSQASRDLSDLNLALTFNGVPYISYLIQAEKNAERLVLGIHGENDTCWDYGSNKLKNGVCTAYPTDTAWKQSFR